MKTGGRRQEAGDGRGIRALLLASAFLVGPLTCEAQEPSDDPDDPFRETSATESNEMLIRGAIRRMRKMEENLQRPVSPEETSRLLRGLSSDQDEVVERLSRLALRLQEC
ncbi:MAG: hypothetical protein HY608_03690 [Planctomycetes bacterium]|nr:hypothetical protein [Planctomycetota bacterium]